jgi:hypothetical protein
MQKNRIGPLSHALHKNQLNMEQNFKERLKTLKLLEENIRKRIPDIVLGDAFFG